MEQTRISSQYFEQLLRLVDSGGIDNNGSSSDWSMIEAIFSVLSWATDRDSIGKILGSYASTECVVTSYWQMYSFLSTVALGFRSNIVEESSSWFDSSSI
jgi:hypothetical protein